MTPILLVVLLLTACGAHVYHTVKRNETLYSISDQYGLNVQDVARWNGIPSPYTLAEGQTIRLAPPLGGAQVASRPPASAPVRPTTAPARPAEPDTVVRVIPLQPQAESERPPVSAAGRVWQWPAQGSYQRTSVAGHRGLDIGGQRSSPVLAAADGRVVYAGTGIAHYGNMLIIKHDEHFLSAYAHNDRLLVREGEFVRAGQPIAEMGSSGTGTDTVKLHFELRLDGEPVDPLEYLPAR